MMGPLQMQFSKMENVPLQFRKLVIQNLLKLHILKAQLIVVEKVGTVV